MVEKSGYGVKLTNRLKSTFDASQLTLVGGPLDGSKAKSRQFMVSLPPSPVETSDSLTAAEFNSTLPRAVADLLFVDKHLQKEGYITGLGGHDYQNLPKIAADMAHRKTADGVVIRIVHGATENMPFRALSSLLPALVLMEQLQKDRIEPPQLQTISAHNLSAQLKRIDILNAFIQAERFAHVARSYIVTFFPSLLNFVTFLQDVPISRGSAMREEIIKVAGVLANESTADTLDNLRIKGINNGARRSYLFYGAAHLLMHDTNFPGSLRPIIPGVPLPTNPSTIISIGGKQEITFYQVRHRIKPFLGANYQTTTLQYFTKHHVPPYSIAQGGDISLTMASNVYAPTEVVTTARYDLDYLKMVSSSRGDFNGFIERQRSITV